MSDSPTFNPGDRVAFETDPSELGTVLRIAYVVKWDNEEWGVDIERSEGVTTPPKAKPAISQDFERDEAGKALLPKNHITLDEARSKLSGFHFNQESMSEDAREVLFYAEALMDELDRRAGGYAR